MEWRRERIEWQDTLAQAFQDALATKRTHTGESTRHLRGSIPGWLPLADEFHQFWEAVGFRCLLG